MSETQGLLRRLLDDFGMSQSHIATMVGTTVYTVRQWSRGETQPTPVRPLPAQLERLYEILGLLGLMKLMGDQQDPVAWLETPLRSLGEDYRLRPLDLCWRGRLGENMPLVYALASTDDDLHSILLDQNLPGWRETCKSTHRVFIADDGHPSLAPR